MHGLGRDQQPFMDCVITILKIFSLQPQPSASLLKDCRNYLWELMHQRDLFPQAPGSFAAVTDWISCASVDNSPWMTVIYAMVSCQCENGRQRLRSFNLANLYLASHPSVVALGIQAAVHQRMNSVLEFNRCSACGTDQESQVVSVLNPKVLAVETYGLHTESPPPTLELNSLTYHLRSVYAFSFFYLETN